MRLSGEGFCLNCMRLGTAFALCHHVCNNWQGMSSQCYAYWIPYLRQAITLFCANLAEGSSSVPSQPVFLACPCQSSLQEALLPNCGLQQMVFLSFVWGSFALFCHEWFFLMLSTVHAGFYKIVGCYFAKVSQYDVTFLYFIDMAFRAHESHKYFFEL
jgi:hypothetical protein